MASFGCWEAWGASVRCRHCKSDKFVKCGCRRTKERGSIQRFKCKACGRTFVENTGFVGRRKSQDVILMVIELYNKALTIRQAAETFGLSKNTVLAWIKFFARLVVRFCSQIKPKYAVHLHVDELFLKMEGTFFYLWSSLDRTTKWAAAHFSKYRTSIEAQDILQKSPIPLNDLTTDGSFAYMRPVRAEYGVAWAHEHYHQCAGFEDKKHNNPIERLNNTWRRHLHPRRDFDSFSTGTIPVTLLCVYYNFIRNHSTINRTPAEEAGVWTWPPKSTERQRWQELIKKS